MDPAAGAPATSVDPADVARFSAIADEWWDPHGKLRALHRLNPLRLGFIREQVLERLGAEAAARAPFVGRRLLDVGCGGGLLTEPMARLGFEVVGIDPSAENISVATAHGAGQGLAIDYQQTTVEDLAAAGEGAFDVVLAMEVIEHVAEPGAFLRVCASLVRPGGVMIVATLNRTAKAFALAKIGAEYVLGWAPVGTHDWRKFVKPEELRAFLSGTGLQVRGPFGVSFDPLAGGWRRSVDASVNYMMSADRPAG